MTPSEQVRKQALDSRRALGLAQVEKYSLQAIDRFLALAPKHPRLLEEGLKVALFLSLPDEVNLASLRTELYRRKAIVHYPRVSSRESGTIEMVEAGHEGAPESWASGPYGIKEPPAHFTAVDPESLDLIIVPGTAFGMNGERIGMGGGYYDRFLARAPRALRVALAFDFQLHPSLEQKPWDQPVHWIITNTREVLVPGYPTP